MTMVVDATPELVAASLAFHLNAGVDHVVAADPGTDVEVTEVLESFSADVVRRLAAGGPERASPSELARQAVQSGADWVIPSRSDEFWWPRGESLRDVLAVIPPRYGVVQALVREFVADGDEDTYFAERMTIRTSLLDAEVPAGDFHRLLRPVYRAQPDLVLDDSDWTLGGRRVPLRAWYPIEVFRFSGARSDEGAGHGTPVEDTRLRDALVRIREEGRESGLTLPVPTVVDDASYAIECAAVGEVDLVRLDAQIRALELRIAELESRFWPTVRRSLKRLARRPG
jgi:hypothetical protein